MDFWRIVAIINKRKWLIMLSVVVTTILTVAATRMVGSRWAAVVTFSADAPLRNIFSGKEVDTVRGKAIADQQAEEYRVRLVNTILPRAEDKLGYRLPDEAVREIAFQAINSRLFALQITDSDPLRAGAVANEAAAMFEEWLHEFHKANYEFTVKTVEKQLREQDQKLQLARADLDQYRAEHGIFGANNGSYRLEGALDRAIVQAHQTDKYEERLAAARAELRLLSGTRPVFSMGEAERDVTAAPRGGVKGKNAQSEPVDPELKAIDETISLLSQKYTSVHPRMKEAAARRKIILAKILEEESKMNVAGAVPVNPAQREAFERRQQQRRIEDQRSDLIREIASLEAQVRQARIAEAAAQGETSNYRGVDGPLAKLTANVDELQQVRAVFVNRLNQARLDLDIQSKEKPLRVVAKVDDRNPVENLTQGRTRKLLILAILCALVGTTALVVAFDSIDRRLRNVKEAQSALPGKMLAAIPQPLGEVSYASLARATELHPQSLHSESYRFLAYQLLSAAGSKARSIMVVAAKAEQGSTTTLTNLGITLAQAGKKVVMVDANMRTAELHTVFELENEYGYMDLLQNPSPESVDKAMQSTSVENLHIITNGTLPENPWRHFRSENLKMVSRELLEKADYVLYDTPSALLFTDSLNLAPVVDGAFLCVRALQQLTGAEQRLVGLLEQSNVEILGSVLTDLPPAVLEGYDNYRHYYGPALQAARGSNPSGMDGGFNGGGMSAGIFALPGGDDRKNGSS